MSTHIAPQELRVPPVQAKMGCTGRVHALPTNIAPLPYRRFIILLSRVSPGHSENRFNRLLENISIL